MKTFKEVDDIIYDNYKYFYPLCKSIDEYYSTKDETSLRKYAGLLGLTVEEVLAWDDV